MHNRKKIRAISFALMLAAVLSEQAFAIPAFPGAEGPGAETAGGRAGRVIEVTNLNGSGPGSLREACEASGPRTVVFKVAGIIDLEGGLINITHPYLTIAGQTAPKGGITLIGHQILLRTHDVVIRFIKVRIGTKYNPGKNAGDALGMYGKETLYSNIVDHCSMSWAHDENGEIWSKSEKVAPHHITYAWNIFAEGLGSHSCGFLTGASNESANNMKDISLHHNLFATNHHRNPMLKIREVKFINNLVYNWHYYATATTGGVHLDMIGNKYKPGPETRYNFEELSVKAQAEIADGSTGVDGEPEIYIRGNIGPNQSDENGDNWGMITSFYDRKAMDRNKFERTSPLPKSTFPITIDSVSNAEISVLEDSGASRRIDENGEWVSDRDTVDARIIHDYKNGTGFIPDSEEEVGGYPTIHAGRPYADSDHDGMSDVWEEMYGLNKNSYSDNAQDKDGDGYTNLEEFINGTDPGSKKETGSSSVQNRVSSSADDAEERLDGSMYLNSSDLELIKERDRQNVGIRFTDLAIPENATITKAYIQFAVDEKSAESTELTVYGESTDNASVFRSTADNISSRVKTSASISWSPPAWNSVGAEGADQRTSDLTPIVQEIVSETGWKSGNAMAFIFMGDGKRVAESYDGDRSKAPLLYVEYTTDPSTIAPVVTLNGANPMNLTVGDAFTDPGATATDNEDGDITASIQNSSDVNTAVAGTYTVTYSVTDSDGNSASEARTVKVLPPPDTIAPVITIIGDNPMSLSVGDTFVDPGATAMDNVDGDLTSSIQTSSNVDTASEGTYVVAYTVRDKAGSVAIEKRTVKVLFPPDTIAPVITLNGANPISLTAGDAFTDPGATATDNEDGDITSSIQTSNTVNTAVAGTYTVTYSVTDSDGNSDSVARTVVVSTAEADTVVYEDAEDGDTTGWSIRDNDPAGATITNVYDEELGSRVIQLSGDGTRNGYELRRELSDGSFADWNDRDNTSIKWNMKYSEHFFKVYVKVDTLKGRRYLVYANYSEPASNNDDFYLWYNIGSEVAGGVWQNVSRNLSEDIKNRQPANDLAQIDSFRVKGSILVDDVIAWGKQGDPVIILIGDNPMNLSAGDAFTDPGATATDNEDGDITSSIQTSNTVNTAVAGTYTVTYSVTDSDGNSDSVARTVVVSTAEADTVVYEDAEDGDTTGWSIYDNDPAGATITNVYDEELGSRVIQLSGDGRRNGYQLRKELSDGSFADWNDRDNTSIKWNMKYSERFFKVYVKVDTLEGRRYLVYANYKKPASNNDDFRLWYNIGSEVAGGVWQSVSRNLSEDIKNRQPANDLTQIDAFRVKGSVIVDDIIATNKNVKDEGITGWSIRDNDPAGATITNVYDEELGSRVIQFSGDGTRNGYELRRELSDGSFADWDNAVNIGLHWKMKYSEHFKIYVKVETLEGRRYLVYANYSEPASNNDDFYLWYNIGSEVAGGVWQNVSRNLSEDIKNRQPANDLTQIDSFRVKGSGRIADIRMFQ